MKRSIKYCLILSVIALGLFFTASQALAADLSTCGNCHDWMAKPNSDVTKFVLPVISDGSATGSTVDKSKCKACHNGDLLAPTHQGVALSVQTVNGVTYGAFIGQSSLYQVPSFLHDKHNGVAMYKITGPTCARCHDVASCTSCHSSVPHTDHYTANPVNPKTGAAIVTPVLNVATGTVFNNNGNIEPTWQIATTCAASECHQKLPAPKRFNADGSDLCYNCHNWGKDGHTGAQVEALHSTTLPNQLITSSPAGPVTNQVDCSGCHNNVLSTEHMNRGKDCVVCHKSTNPGIILVVQNAGGIEANRGCEKCHFNGTLAKPEHTLNHIATQSNNLKVDGGPHTNCNTCHQRQEVLPTIVSLANSTVKDYSCLTCHTGAPKPKAPVHKGSYNGNVQLLTDFHSCNTCHDPNATYSKDPSKKPSDDVLRIANNDPSVLRDADGNYLCTNCHSNLAAGHQAQFNGKVMTTTDYHIDCATCHKNTEMAPIIQTLKGTSGYACQSCHATTRTADAPPYSPLHSAKGEEITGYHTTNECNSCHGVVNGAYKVNISGIKAKVLNGGYECTACHGTLPGIPMGKHNGLTSDSAVTPLNVSAKYHPSCATCHKDARVNGPTGPIATLKASGATSYLCTQCHSSTYGLAPRHQAELSADVNVAGTVYEITQFHIDGTGAISCDKCHDNNTVLPTSTISTLRAQSGYKCASCHNNTLAPAHSAALSTGGTPEVTLGYHKDCLVCHTNNAVKTSIGTGTFQNSYLCTTCHNGSTAPQPNHMAKADVNATSENISSTYHANCNKCHGNPNYPAVNDIIKQTAAAKETDYLCTKCHNATLGLEPGHKAKMAVSDTVYATITNYHLDATGNTACGMCHGSSKLPAGTIATLKAQPSYLCDDCHNTPTSQVKYSHTANYGTDATNQKTTDYHYACQTCHDSAAAKPVVKSLIGQSGYDCTQCHDGTTASKALHQAKMSSVADAVYTVSYHPDCVTCHKSTKENVVNFIKTNKGATAPYLCSDCHTDFETKHIGPSISGGLVNCSWCHSNELTSTHVNPTIQLPKQMDCATCHSANSPVRTQINLHQKACSDCHNGTTLDSIHPGKQYIPKHTAVFPTFMPEYAPNCVNCHSGSTPGSTPTIDALHSNYTVGCTDCHTNTVYKTAIASQNTNCAGCHDKSVNPAINPSMEMFAAHDSKHTVNVAVYQDSAQCLSCHKPDSVVASVYTTYSSVNNLLPVHKKKPTYTKVTGCETCHASSRPEVTQAIAAGNTNCVACHPNADHKHAVTSYEATPEVNCVNCHSTGTDPANATTEITSLHSKYGKSCATCHTDPFLGNVIAGDGSIDMLKSGTTPIYCSTCHNGDVANKYAPTAASKHAPEHQASQSENVNCSSCHDGTTVKGSFNAPAGTAVNFAGIHTTNGCNTCHDNAKVMDVISSKVGKDNSGANAYNCAACHDGTKAGTHNKQHTVKSYLNGSSDNSCASCHSNGDVTAIHSGTSGSGGALNCDTCHGANPALPNTATVIKANLSSNANRTGFSCQDCHSEITGGHNHSVTANGYDAAPKVDCTKCHATAADGSTELTAVHKTAADQGKIQNYGCTTCHNDKFVGTGKVILGDGKIDMKQNAATQIYCTTCHNGTLADALGTKYPAHDGNHINATGYGDYKGTYNGQAFDDSGADCSKCHASLDTKVVHDPAVHSNLSCNSCHQSSNTAVQSVINGAWSRTATKAAYTCSSCHSTLPYLHKPEHTGTSADAANLNCSGCHNAASWTSNNAQVVGVHNSNCNTCHASSNSVVSSFIASKKGLANPVYNCESCHTTGGAQTKEALHKPEHQAKHSATGMDCTSCHSFNVTAGNPTDISSLHKNGCNTCHGSSTRNDVKLVIASKVGQSNPVYNCEDCHGTIHAGWDAKHKPIFPTNDPNLDCAKCHNNYLPAEHEKALSAAGTAVGYSVFRSTDNANWTKIGSTTATGYADTGLAANTTYYYKLQAYDGKPNYSGFSNVATVKTLSNSPVITTVNPDLARYASGNNGDSSADPSSTTDVLSRLTDNSNSTYSTVKENGSSDQYIFVKVNDDAQNYTKVQLKMAVRYYNSANLQIYPYSNDTTINTNASYVVEGPYRFSSISYITETIDVTKAAQAMKGFGWMKFRIKPDSSRSATVYIANVQLILSQNPVSGGAATNPSGNLTPNSSDTVAPSTPGGLSGSTNYYDRIDLTWTASTDTAPSGNTCAVCHASTAPQRAKDAIAAKNANCSACHDLHGDIATVHTGNALPTTPWQCSGCHTNVLSVEHSASAKLQNNATLNCDTCHSSSLAKVKAAINSTVTDKSNLNCSACHTGTADGVPAVHSDIAAPHMTGIFPMATDATCLNCHTTQAAEFAATKAAYHEVGSLSSKANTSFGSYLSPWTATSTVGCQGCHGNNNDGKAQAANILKRPYTYTSNSSQADMLCFLCHDRNTYGGGSGGGKSGFSSGSTNLHNIGDHESGRVQCSWCHSSVPHGTNKAHLIVTKTDPNSAGSVLTNFTHPASGQYRVSSCGSDVSLCDEHR